MSPRLLALLMLQAALCHFGRVGMSVAGSERIMAEYALSETAMGAVYSAFLLAYTLCMVPGGWFIDRRGPHAALVVVGLGSAACAALTGAVGSLALPAALALPALVVVRAAAGVVSAPLHPAAARGVALWTAPPARPVANGLVTGAALGGIASTYVAFGFLMDRLTWPGAFLATALAMAAVTGLWVAQARRVAPPHDPGARVDAGARPLWRDRSLVLLTLSYAAVGYVQYLFFYWMQFYFERVLLLGNDRARLFSTAATLAMAVGMVAGGWSCGRLERRLGRRRGRAAMTGGCLLLAAALMAAGALGRDPSAVVVSFALALAAIGACESAFWTTATDLGGARGGASAALVNTGGNVGGVLAPVVTPLVAAHLGWRGGLGLATAVCLLGAVAWIGIRPPARGGAHLRGAPD